MLNCMVREFQVPCEPLLKATCVDLSADRDIHCFVGGRVREVKTRSRHILTQRRVCGVGSYSAGGREEELAIPANQLFRLIVVESNRISSDRQYRRSYGLEPIRSLLEPRAPPNARALREEGPIAAVASHVTRLVVKTEDAYARETRLSIMNNEFACAATPSMSGNSTCRLIPARSNATYIALRSAAGTRIRRIGSSE